MFINYFSLVKGPYIAATHITDYACQNMFRGAYKLNYLKVSATSKSGTYWFYYALNPIASKGTFVCTSQASFIFWKSRGSANRQPSGWNYIVEE